MKANIPMVSPIMSSLLTLVLESLLPEPIEPSEGAIVVVVTLDEVIVNPAIVAFEAAADSPDKAVVLLPEEGSALPATTTDPKLILLKVMQSTFVLFSPIDVRRDVTRVSMLLKTLARSTPAPERVKEKLTKVFFRHFQPFFV